SVHAGIWTSAALGAAPQSVPRLRKQMSALLDRLDFDPGNHDGKTLGHAFAVLPHDLVIGFPDAAVEHVVTAMMALIDRPRPRVALVSTPLDRHLFAFVWFPRDMLSLNVRPRIHALLEEQTGGTVIDWSLTIDGGNLAALRYAIDISDPERFDEKVIDDALQTMLRGWPEAIEAELAVHEEQGRAAAIAVRYAEAFPQAYRADYGAAEAALDIVRLRGLQAAEPPAVEGRGARLYRLPADDNGRLRLKIYQMGGVLPLSDAVPALENFGFRVMSEVPTALDSGRLGTIHDLALQLPAGDDGARVLERAGAIEEAISAVLNNAAENDVFNRLTVGAALSARDANLLRAFYRYLRQAGISYTIYT
ncbi:MAG: glutamate dehydrogenase, partial [Oxalobacteraceae bacterium]